VCPFLDTPIGDGQNTLMGVPRITKEELKERLEHPTTAPVLVDARLKYPFEHSSVTLPGAVRIRPRSLDLSRLPADREVVAYDSDPDELSSERLAVELIRKGYRVSVLKGGIGDWMTAKYPVDSKPYPHPAPPPPGGLKG
jgi:rhodanese-related sulfurtransferase